MDIHKEAELGHIEAVASLISANPELVRARDFQDHTPLHRANHAGLARLLLARGADVDARGWMGETPLHSAARRGAKEVVMVLVESGADVNARRPERNDTPLHFAADEDTAGLLLRSGAEREARDLSGRVPLHWAAQFGREAVAELLIHAGTDVNVRDVNGETPLHWAAEEGHVGTAGLLCRSGAELNVQDRHGRTPLHHAAWRGHGPVVSLLLERGADRRLKNRVGQTAQQEAAEKHDPAIAEIFRTTGDAAEREEASREDAPPLPQAPELDGADQLRAELKADFEPAARAALIRYGLAGPAEIRGCTDAEVSSIENHFKLALPGTYKKLLRTIGRGAGDFYLGTDMFFPTLLRLREGAEELLAESNSPFSLAHGAFVFLMHQGYQVMFFDVEMGEDPPVWMFAEAELEPRQVSESLSEWFIESIAEHLQ